MHSLYQNFGLVLMVTRACNLRCSYCYAGTKTGEIMPLAVGEAAIRRASRSLLPGGVLELGFFGGEPLLVSATVRHLLDYARTSADSANHRLVAYLSTNGMVDDEPARRLLADRELQVTVSCDGPPQSHDRHRRTVDNKPSSAIVTATLQRLLAEGREPAVSVAVTPETVGALPDTVLYFRDLGVGFVQFNLNLWARWSEPDLAALEQAIAACADLWRAAPGRPGINWFDEMAVRLAHLPLQNCARCAFGAGQVAVSPAGWLYPCERLIGDDQADHPWRLPGTALDGEHFLEYGEFPERAASECAGCTIRDFCSTYCRCGNLVRTGDMTRPDRLLCVQNKACFRETVRVMQS